jgi:phosphate transport system substrate-binding protein
MTVNPEKLGREQRAVLQQLALLIARFLVFAMALWTPLASGQNLAALLKSMPAYKADRQVTGTIRIWGKSQMRDIVNQWETGFDAHHPGVRFQTNLRGGASAIGGLYTGAADIAFTEADFWPGNADGFEEVFGYKPFRTEVCTSSLAAHNLDFTFVVFVHRDNPLSHLTLAQVDAVFGGDRRRGSKMIRTWGDLGLQGEWAIAPIHTYGYSPENQELARFFEDAVMAGSRKWNCDLHGFRAGKQVGGRRIEAGQQIVDAVAKDRYSIGYSSLRYRNPLAKSLALAPAMAKDKYSVPYAIETYKLPVVKADAPQYGGPYFEPTTRNIIERNYPLTRSFAMVINRVPGRPIEPTLKEFLRYVLSREGQKVIIRDGNYLPLNGEILMHERRKLE